MINKIWSTFQIEEKKIIVFLFIILLIVGVLELFGLVLVIPYVNIMVDNSAMVGYAHKYPILDHFTNSTNDYRVEISLWFASFYLLKNLLLSGFMFIEQTLLKIIQTNIKDRMYFYYMRQPYTFHLDINTSKLVRSISYDANRFLNSVLKSISILISEILLFLGVLVVLVINNPIALYVFLFMIFPVIVTYILIKRRIVLWGEIVQQRESDSIRFLQEGIGGIKEVIILGVQKYFEDGFHNNVVRQTHINRNIEIIAHIPRYIIEAFIMISLAVSLYWVTQSGGVMANLSSIAFLGIASVRILPMSNRVLSSINSIRSAFSSIEVVSKVAAPNLQLHELEEKTLDSVLPFHNLTIDSLSFWYKQQDRILNQLDFKINSAETIGVVGGSGAGKTTLIDLLLGLFIPSDGKILCNGLNIHDDLRQWQSRIGYVQQSIFLLDANIKQNIAFAIPNEEINMERVEEVIRLTRLESWIDTLSNGVETNVGEKGIKISGGQRQRIGIARALYHNPEILVLDEATSALDNRTEKGIMDDIYTMQGDKTIIIIAHRLDTIRRCDRILVLDDGKIVGEGTFDELFKTNKIFQNIGAFEE